MALRQASPLRVGMLAYPSEKWLGGVSYIQNLLRALALSDEAVELSLFLISPDHPLLQDPALSTLNYRVLPHINQRNGWQQYRTTLERLLQFRKAGLNVLHNFLFSRLPQPLQIPSVSWLPDFQYRRHPGFFAEPELRKRTENDVRAAQFARRIILSSQDARQDFEQMFPPYAYKARVVHFTSVLTPQDMALPTDPCRKFHLASPFFLVSNQFWKHKNHGLVFKAIQILQQLTTREFQVVFTGSVLDYRNPTYFNELLQLLNESGVRRHCVILGQISRAEMLQLICRSMSVIQPSFFEGWNTVVEECRALNVPILLSDIAVHREQAQVAGLQAAFFDPVTPEELARLMLEVLEGRLFDLADPAKGSLNEAWVRQNAQRYAAELVAVWNEATTQA